MKLNKKIIISIALTMLTILTLANVSLAIDPDDSKWNPQLMVATGKQDFLTKVGVVLGWIKYIGIMVAVIVLAIIGVKYMFSSVEGKAEYKKTMLPYVVGCFMLMAVSAVIAIIGNLANF